MKKFHKVGEILIEIIEVYCPAGSSMYETGNFRIVEKSDLEEMYPVKSMFYVCSHGASLERPLLVNESDAKWLKDNGVEVYTLEEYKEKCNK